jgi:hypothetical protein
MNDDTDVRQRLRQRLTLRLKLAERERGQVITNDRRDRRTPASTSERWTPAAGRVEFKGVDPIVGERDGMFFAEAHPFRRWGASPEQARRNLAIAMREG